MVETIHIKNWKEKLEDQNSNISGEIREALKISSKTTLIKNLQDKDKYAICTIEELTKVDASQLTPHVEYEWEYKTGNYKKEVRIVE